MDREIWNEIDNTDGLYHISNHGRVKSFLRGYPYILKLQKGASGYYEIRLFRFNNDKKTIQLKVARHVGIHFVPNPNNKPCINHIDGNKLNNYYKNIEWVTIKENLQHAAKLGLNRTKKAQDNRSKWGKINHRKVTYETAEKIRKEYVPYKITQEALAKKYGVNAWTIQVIVNNKFYLTN